MRSGEQDKQIEDGGPDDEVEAPPPPPPWGSRTQVLAAVLWSSFLAACLATMLFFAIVDPGFLHDPALEPDVESTRMSGYGIGFFFFWFVAIVASAVSVYLIRTSHLSDRDKDGPQ